MVPHCFPALPSRKVARFLSAFLPLLIVAPPAQADWSRKVGTEVSLGKNLVGEECRAVLERHDTDYDFAKHRIYCGAWAEPSGELNSWTFKRNRTNRDWRDRQKYWWRPSIDRRFDCRAAEDSEILDGVNVAMLDCRTRTGGFAYLAYVGKIGKRIFFADFIPANANVVATLSGVVSDKIAAQETQVGSTSRLVAALRSRTVNEPGILYAADAFAGFGENYKLGRLLNHAKEHAAAVRAFTRALGFQRDLLGDTHSSTGETIARIGNDLRNQGLRAQALAKFDEAEALLAGSANKSHLAELYVYRSYDARSQGDYDRAVSFADRAAGLRRDYWGRENSWVAHAIYAKARAQLEAGDLDGAENAAEESLRLYEGDFGRVHHWPANLRYLLAEIESRQGDHGDALESIDRALDIRERLFGKGLAYAQALWRRAEVHRRNGNAAAAEADFITSVDLLSAAGLADRLGRASIDPDQLAGQIAAAAPSHEAGGGGGLGDALLTAVQLPRHGVSKRVISQMAARSAAGNPEIAALTRDLQDRVARRDDLRYDLGRASGRKQKRRNPEREALWAEELERIEAEIADLSRALQGRHPGYARLLNPRPVTRGDLAAILSADEAIARFVVGEDATVTVLATATSLDFHVADIGREALGEEIRRLRIAVEEGGRAPFDMRRSHALFSKLFGPLADKLAGMGHLFVVPDGPLASFPPALFVTDAPPQRKRAYAEAVWLSDRVSVSLLPTIGALRQLRSITTPSEAKKPFLGIADPAFAAGRGGNPGADGAACDDAFGAPPPAVLRSLAPLPETADEVKRIAAALGGSETDLALGSMATETHVRGLRLKDYRGISFATHGLLPSEVDCATDPGLVLTGGEGTGAEQDGYLAASEIFQLELDAEWVLLSACNTATVDGRLTGESLSSLTSGFFFAGARSVIASHWPVASQPTVRLTTDTFSRSEGTSRAEALRQAQRAMMAEEALSHPVFWAPFTIYGDRD